MLKKKNIYLVKSRMDKVLSVLILVATLPFILVTSIVISVILKSSPLIFQERGITKNNQTFKIIKFRTMKKNASCTYDKNNIFYKPYLSEYVPLYCKWLRKTGMDELPQLINVIKGEMSLIGPRPLMINDLEILEKDNPIFYSLRNTLKVKPGITGLWQVFGDRNKGVGNLINLDIQYEEQISFNTDLKIFLRTIPLVVKGMHSDAVILDIEKHDYNMASEYYSQSSAEENDLIMKNFNS